jgi:hypothetical protein
MFEECGHCSKGSSVTVPMCPHCGVRKSVVRKAKVETIAKGATSEEAIYKRAHDDFETKLEAFKVANVGKGINAFLQTEEGAAASMACNEAHHALKHPNAIAKAEAFSILEQELLVFCKREGITKIWTVGLEKFRETEEGRALNDDFNEAL